MRLMEVCPTPNSSPPLRLPQELRTKRHTRAAAWLGGSSASLEPGASSGGEESLVRARPPATCRLPALPSEDPPNADACLLGLRRS